MIGHTMNALFIFRRDLRYQDNTGLQAAISSGLAVIPCFIVDPEQVGSTNPYRGAHALQFMIESLKELNENLRARGGKLYLFYGKPEEIVERLISQEKISLVCVNADYTPYSRERDARLESICTRSSIAWHSHADALLIEPAKGVNAAGQALSDIYTVL